MKRMIIASCCLLSATAASATSPITFGSGEPPTAVISVAGLDLHSVRDRAVVERRIERAAEELCFDVRIDPIPGQSMERYSRCIDHSMTSGLSQLEELASRSN